MSISISIQAGSTIDESRVVAKGQMVDLISDEERVMFGITDAELIGLVGEYAGRNPDKVFLRDHPHFELYGWKETQRILKVVDTEIVSLDFKPVALVVNHYENRRSKNTISHRSSLTHGTSVSASTQWNITTKGTLKQKIKYEIGFLGTGVGGETSLSFETGYGQGASESRASSISTTNMAIFTIDPGQTVKAVLSASRGVMRVKVTYRAELEGDIYYDYTDTYKGAHRWSMPVIFAQAKGDIGTTVDFSEIIEVGFYANAQVIVEDGAPLALKEQADENEINLEGVPVQVIELG